MEVILLERIEKLGQMGDVVSVKPGFARNYLLPQGKALRSNKTNLAFFENQRTQLEAENLELKSEAEKVAEKLNGQSFIAIRQAGDSGQLYGSVNTRDIASLLTEGGFTANRGQVFLEHPIKVLGLHDVRIILHPEVSSSVVLNVARTEEEAERQARGEDVTIDQFDEDDKYDPGEAGQMFEDEDDAREAAKGSEDAEASDEEEAAPEAEAETETAEAEAEDENKDSDS